MVPYVVSLAFVCEMNSSAFKKVRFGVTVSVKPENMIGLIAANTATYSSITARAELFTNILYRSELTQCENQV